MLTKFGILLETSGSLQNSGLPKHNALNRFNTLVRRRTFVNGVQVRFLRLANIYFLLT